MFGFLRKFRENRIFVKRVEEIKLLPKDKQIVTAVIKHRGLTPVKIVEKTGMNRRTVFHRLNSLVARGVLRNNGGVYFYTNPSKVELRVTPIMGLMTAIGAGYAYLTGNSGVAIFSFLFFLASYFAESLGR